MEQLGQFILNHLGLVSALIIILILIFINEFISQKKKAKELTPAGVVKLMNHDDAVVIDSRDAETFASGHIINAIRASGDEFTKERIKKYKQKPIVLVCARGLQSPALATKLREQGFENVAVLSGGMNAWQTANLPTVKGK
jgi:rhodanese-related sulfurtransferase